MSQSAKPVHVGRDVLLYDAAGEPVSCVIVWLWNTPSLSARLLLTSQQWDRVRSMGLFDVDDLSLPADYEPVDSLLVELEAIDTSLPTDATTVTKRFADPDSSLRSTDAWTATDVRDHDSVAGPAAGSERPSTADAPRVNDVGISMQQSEPSSNPDGASTASSATMVDSDGLTEPLSHVAAELTAENRPFEPHEDGTSLSLTATVEHATWQVRIEDLTGTDGSEDGADSPCRICSVHPHQLGEARRTTIEPELVAYTETLNRGGFVVESTARTASNDADFTVKFQTPFDPQTEPTSDALTENVTALAEWFDRLAA